MKHEAVSEAENNIYITLKTELMDVNAEWFPLPPEIVSISICKWIT
jgi:hypothetical protein